MDRVDFFTVDDDGKMVRVLHVRRVRDNGRWPKN